MTRSPLLAAKLALLAAVAAGGCDPSLTVPASAVIACDDGVCPPDYTCSAGRCVADDNSAPTLALRQQVPSFRIGVVPLSVLVTDGEGQRVTITAQLERAGVTVDVALTGATVEAAADGTPAELGWDAAAFFGGNSRQDDLRLILTATDARGTSGPVVTTDAFEFGVEAPVLELGGLDPAPPARRPLNGVEVPITVADPNDEEAFSVTVDYRVEVAGVACAAWTAPSRSDCDAAGWCRATPLSTSPVLAGLPAAASGTAVVFAWDLLADADDSTACAAGLFRRRLDTDGDGLLGAPDAEVVGYTPLVTVRVVAQDSSGVGSLPVEATLALGDDATVATLTPFGLRNSQQVPVGFSLADSAADPADIEVQFRLPGETAGTGWRAIAPGLGSFSDVTTAASGFPGVVTWDSAAPTLPDPTQPQGVGAAAVDDIEVRLRAVNRVDGTQWIHGPWSPRAVLDVRNQTAPTIQNVQLPRTDLAPFSGPVAVHYNVIDEESDPVDVSLEYCVTPPCAADHDWRPCREYRTPASEGSYDLASAPAALDGVGGVPHTFFWDPGDSLESSPASYVRLRLAAFDDFSAAPAQVDRCGTFDRAACTTIYARLNVPANLPSCQALDSDGCAAAPGCAWRAAAARCEPPAFPTGVAPVTLVPADVNGDGILDLLTFNIDSVDISVLLGQGAGGTGDGTFAPPLPGILAPSTERGLAVGDVNGDLAVDLVLLDSPADAIVVEDGLGDGTFGPERSFPTGTGPYPRQAGRYPSCLALADVSGDGILDILTGNRTADLTVLRGQGASGVGDGTFAPPQSFPVGHQPAGLLVLDANGDGIVDVLTRSPVVRLPGVGDGTFGAPEVVGASSGLVVAADFDADGVVDLLTTHPELGLAVLRNEGGGSFTALAGSPMPIGFGPSAAADVNGDGLLDVLGTVRDDDALVVLLGRGSGGRGDGTFGAPSRFGVGDGPIGVIAADLDGDGQIEALTLNLDSSDVSVLRAQAHGSGGDATFATTVAFAVDNVPTRLALADLDADGILDAVTSHDLAQAVTVALGSGVGGAGDGGMGAGVSAAASEGPFLTSAVAIADVNADGILDILTANRDSNQNAPGSVSVLIGHGDGGVGDGRFAPPVAYPTGATPLALAADDVDGDGILDIVTANFGSYDVAVLRGGGAGDGTFSAPAMFAVGDYLTDILVVDVSGDGILDLVAASYGLPAVAVLLGAGTDGAGDGTFAAPSRFPLAGAPQCLTAADFDGDGILDVAAVTTSGTVEVVRGQGSGGVADGTFGAAAVVATGPFADIEAADVSGDGVLDLVVGGTGTTILVGEASGGLGTGAFSAPLAATGPFAISIAPGDLDRDGLLDVVGVDYERDALTVLLGQGRATSGRLVWLFSEAAASSIGSRAVGPGTVEPWDRCDRSRAALGPTDPSCRYEQAGLTLQSVADSASWAARARSSVPGLRVGVMPLTPVSRALGDVRWARVPDPPNAEAVVTGSRLRVEARFGPYRCGDGVLQAGEDCDDAGRSDGDGCSARCTVEPGWSCDSGACVRAPGSLGTTGPVDFDRVGLSTSATPVRALIVALPGIPARCLDQGPAPGGNGVCDLVDAGAAVQGAVWVVRQGIDWVRADDPRFACSATPPLPGAACDLGQPVAGACDPLTGSAIASRYLPRLPRCVPNGAGGGVVSYRDVVLEVESWETIPVDPDGDLQTDAGDRFTLEPGAAATELWVRVLTSRLGAFQAFLVD